MSAKRLHQQQLPQPLRRSHVFLGLPGQNQFSLKSVEQVAFPSKVAWSATVHTNHQGSPGEASSSRAVSCKMSLSSAHVASLVGPGAPVKLGWRRREEIGMVVNDEIIEG